MTANEWVQNDHETVETDLTTLDGAPSDLDLSGRTVHYVLRHYSGAIAANKEANVNGTTATVKLEPSNLSRKSSHKAEWIVTEGADDPTTLPKDEPIPVHVRPSVDDGGDVVKPPLKDGTVDTLTANALDGNLTGGQKVTQIAGTNLAVDANGALVAIQFSGDYGDLANVPSEFTPEAHGDAAHSADYSKVGHGDAAHSPDYSRVGHDNADHSVNYIADADGTITQSHLSFDTFTQTEFSAHESTPDAHHTKTTDSHADVADSSGVVQTDPTETTHTASGAASVSVGTDGSGGATIDVSATDTDTQLTAEEVHDIVGAFVTAAGAASVTYDDGNGTLTIESTDTDTQLTDEQVQDIVGSYLAGGTNAQVAYDDAGNVLTIHADHDHSGDTLGTASSPVTTAHVETTNTKELSVTEDFNPAGTESVHFNFLPPAEYLRDNSSGSGFGAVSKPGALLFGTGGTQGSLGECWYYPGDDNDVTSPIEIQDWSRDRSWRCYVSVNDVGEIIRFGNGLLRDDDQWDGFEFDSGALYAVSNDSNTKNRTQIDSAPSPGAYDFRMEFTSGTRTVYYVDGTQRAEHTSNLPSGDSRAPFIFAGRAENPNSATDTQGSYQKIELVVHQ